MNEAAERMAYVERAGALREVQSMQLQRDGVEVKDPRHAASRDLSHA